MHSAVIKRLKPDLVALQEVDQRVRRSGSVDQAAELGKLTGMHHAFGSFFKYDGGNYGMAVLSRWRPRSMPGRGERSLTPARFARGGTRGSS